MQEFYQLGQTHYHYTVEPLSKGHFGISHFVLCREVVLFSEVKNILMIGKGAQKSVLCREVVLFLEGPLLRGSTVIAIFMDSVNNLPPSNL